MKCKLCGTIMDIHKYETHLHFSRQHGRCPNCGYQDMKENRREIPSPTIEKSVKKSKE